MTTTPCTMSCEPGGSFMICISATIRIRRTLAEKTPIAGGRPAEDQGSAADDGCDRLKQIGLAHIEERPADIGAEDQSHERREHRGDNEGDRDDAVEPDPRQPRGGPAFGRPRSASGRTRFAHSVTTIKATQKMSMIGTP